MHRRFFSDLTVGETHDLGLASVSRDGLIEFGQRFDPQPYHVDEAKAEDSIYGGLIASGFHTAALGMRLAVEGYLRDIATLGGRGVDDLQWLTPIRPGDTLHGRGKLLEKMPSSSRPERGYISYQVKLTNQDDTDALAMTLLVMVKRRNGD